MRNTNLHRTAVLLASLAAAVIAPPLLAAESLKVMPACVNGSATEIQADANLYSKKGLKPKCSANMNIYYAQNAVGIVMAVNSTKGRNTYVGSSMAGKLSQHKPCASACTAAEAEAAVRDLLAAGTLN